MTEHDKLPDDLNTLSSLWMAAKQAEADATADRRKIEDQITEMIDLDMQKEGTTTLKASGFSVKITTRLTRKIDSDLVQEIAAENGLSLYLPRLFRWKPEINAIAWKGAPNDVTAVLSKAITTTAGRPSYSISAITKE